MLPGRVAALGGTALVGRCVSLALERCQALMLGRSTHPTDLSPARGR